MLIYAFDWLYILIINVDKTVLNDLWDINKAFLRIIKNCFPGFFGSSIFSTQRQQLDHLNDFFNVSIT